MPGGHMAGNQCSRVTGCAEALCPSEEEMQTSSP
jgi:hypothetical protein